MHLQQFQDELREQREVKAKLTAIDHAHQSLSISLSIWLRNKSDKAARQRISEGVKAYNAALNAVLAVSPERTEGD